MATYKELVKAYEKAGRPSDSDAVHQILMDAGLSHEQAMTAFEAAGQYLAPKEEASQSDPLDQVEIPVGYTITSKTGKEFTWKGAQWTSKGQIVPKQYSQQVTQAAKQKIQSDKQAAQKDADDANIESTRMKDAEHEFENIPSSSPSAKQQQAELDPNDHSTSSPTTNDYLQDLANQINASPNRAMLVKGLGGASKDTNTVSKIAEYIKTNGLERQARAELGRYTDR